MTTDKVLQVCIDGHIITDDYKNNLQDRRTICDECGEKTINQCPNCNYPITDTNQLSVGSKYPIPDKCSYCGSDFPWKKKVQIVKNPKRSILLCENIFNNFLLDP